MSRAHAHHRFRYLEPTFCGGLLDDPVLYLRVRPAGTGLLFDCGQIHHLAKRLLKSVTAVFISHAHMDHFMGIDTLIRHHHVSPQTIDIFGPPGIARKMAGKFSAYDWNLTEPSWCSFRVHEVFPGSMSSYLFAGPEGFPCRFLGEEHCPDRVIYRSRWLRVEAAACEHRIPSLVFRVSEREAFGVDGARLAAAGFEPGEWLKDLKKRYFAGWRHGGPVKAPSRSGGEVTWKPVTDVEGLYAAICRRETPSSIGYVSDVAGSEANRATIEGLLTGVSLLVCECSFLASGLEKARESSHLCTSDFNLLLQRLRPAAVLPMHLSKSYRGQGDRLYAELALPPGVRLVRLPERLTPRPLLTEELFRVGRELTPGTGLPAGSGEFTARP